MNQGSLNIEQLVVVSENVDGRFSCGEEKERNTGSADNGGRTGWQKLFIPVSVVASSWSGALGLQGKLEGCGFLTYLMQPSCTATARHLLVRSHLGYRGVKTGWWARIGK